ncbi:general secretion pathway protein GspB [Rhodoferax sp.]|uniref:general secretion pathway protein GspB n=1 Tax=Rhodoferax sp. TaxID=50421 RepID=UPI0025D8452D|nr:general secretion pathway protein GspB [Rhodoferax sp.]MCM2296127.1 general secretion pathway protein GspB [Rhodoferax sp.]
MSYILDALKRADTERERGAAPGLHTRHQLPSGGPANPTTRRPLWLAVAGGVTLLLLAAGFWLWRAPVQPGSVALQAPAQPQPAPIAPTEPIVASAPPTAIPPMTPAPVQVAQTPRVQAPPLATPTPAKAAAAPSSKPAATVKTPVSAPAATAPPSPVAATSAPAPAAVPLLAELPQDLRSQIPKITITGSVYSASPTQRLLLANNLVLAQGAQIAPDLTLEEIQPRSSVFTFQGTRFRVMH